MKTKELDVLEEKWDKISRMTEKAPGNKEWQKAEILKRHGISSLSPKGNNLSEPELDTKFQAYLQTRRKKNNQKLTFWVGVLEVIIAAGILVTMILIALFKD